MSSGRTLYFKIYWTFYIKSNIIKLMNRNKFFMGILIATIGLLMVLSPDSFIKFAVIILGISAIIDGIFILVTTKNLIVDPHFNLMMAIRGWMSIAVGTLAVVLPLAFAAVLWMIMSYTLGVYLIISAGLQIYGITQLHRNGIMVHRSVIEVLVSIVLAALLLLIPSEKAGHLIVYSAGAVLILSGLILSIFQWVKRPITVIPENVRTIDDEDSDKAADTDQADNADTAENSDKTEK